MLNSFKFTKSEASFALVRSFVLLLLTSRTRIVTSFDLNELHNERSENFWVNECSAQAANSWSVIANLVMRCSLLV
ncbi:MAG: hypothetical protein ACTS6G_04915 [Candidatus Hodgkinia cicadicola]